MMQFFRLAQPSFLSLAAPAFLLAASLAQPAGAQSATRTTLSVATESGSTQFTAHVTSGTGAAVTSGTVSFEAGAASLGAAPVDGSGQAQLSVHNLPVAEGVVPVVAVFHPAASASAASASPTAQVHTDAEGVPTYTVTAASTTLSTPAGGYASTVLTVTPLNGYVAQVTLSCENLPAYATCAFSPVAASTANGAFTSTLQIQTEGPGGVTQLLGPGTLALGSLLPLGLLGLAGWRRRGPYMWLALGFTVVGLASLTGCGSRYGYEHHPPTEPGGTPTGTAYITVDASGNTGSAVTPVMLKITLDVQ